MLSVGKSSGNYNYLVLLVTAIRVVKVILIRVHLSVSVFSIFMIFQVEFNLQQ